VQEGDFEGLDKEGGGHHDLREEEAGEEGQLREEELRTHEHFEVLC
jgi:hypothetical protein